jgi:ATP-dependent 26S proteasome regulatory subunit
MANLKFEDHFGDMLQRKWDLCKQKVPCLVLIDDLDTLAPKKTDNLGEFDIRSIDRVLSSLSLVWTLVERRFISQLCGFFDEMDIQSIAIFFLGMSTWYRHVLS